MLLQRRSDLVSVVNNIHGHFGAVACWVILGLACAVPCFSVFSGGRTELCRAVCISSATPLSYYLSQRCGGARLDQTLSPTVGESLCLIKNYPSPFMSPNLGIFT